MIKKIFLFFFLFTAIYTFGQKVSLSYNFGYGFYNLFELKKFQDELLPYYKGFELKPVIKFPNYIFHTGILEYKIAEASFIGINGAYYTTGALNLLEDYSGKISTDFILNAYEMGFNYKYVFLAKSKVNFSMMLKVGLLFSSLDIKDRISISIIDSTLEEAFNFTSLGNYVEPQISVRYFFIRQLALTLNIGYELTTRRDLINSDKRDDISNTLTLPNERTNVTANWSGFRPSIGLTYAF